MRIKRTIRQRGDHHAALIVGAVVVLAGVLGFVGYNSWQNQSANAGSCFSKYKGSDLDSLKARRGCLADRLNTINANITSIKQSIRNHPNQTKANEKRKAKVDALVKQINDNNYASKIADLDARIARAASQSNRLKASENNSGKSATAPSVSTGISNRDCLALGRVAIGSNSCLKKCSDGGKLASGYPYDFCSNKMSQLSKSICDANGRKWIGVSNGNYCASGPYSCKDASAQYRSASPYNTCTVNRSVSPANR